MKRNKCQGRHHLSNSTFPAFNCAFIEDGKTMHFRHNWIDWNFQSSVASLPRPNTHWARAKFLHESKNIQNEFCRRPSLTKFNSFLSLSLFPSPHLAIITKKRIKCVRSRQPNRYTSGNERVKIADPVRWAQQYFSQFVLQLQKRSRNTLLAVRLNEKTNAATTKTHSEKQWQRWKCMGVSEYTIYGNDRGFVLRVAYAVCLQPATILPTHTIHFRWPDLTVMQIGNSANKENGFELIATVASHTHTPNAEQNGDANGNTALRRSWRALFSAYFCKSKYFWTRKRMREEKRDVVDDPRSKQLCARCTVCDVEWCEQNDCFY